MSSARLAVVAALIMVAGAACTRGGEQPAASPSPTTAVTREPTATAKAERAWRSPMAAQSPAVAGSPSAATPRATPTPKPPPTEAPSTATPTPKPAIPPPRLSGIWALCRDIGTSADWLESPPVAGEGYVYRCYEGRPLRCETGASGGACMRLYTEEPPGLADYCLENPDEESPPLAVVGHAPMPYIWACSGGEALAIPNPGFDPADYDDLGFYMPAWEAVPESAY